MPSKDKAVLPIRDIDVPAHSFMAVKPEKRERIIAACWEEFAKGYDKANTDVITQKAGISKGNLYYHFGTKQNLFFFLIKYSADLISEEFRKADIKNRDYLKVVRSLGLVSMNLTEKYLPMYQFLIPAINYTKEHFPEALEGYVVPTEQILAEAFENYDPVLFKDGLDIPKACNIIRWVLKGYSDYLSEKAKGVTDYSGIYESTPEEFDDYLQMLRHCFYKQEDSV